MAAMTSLSPEKTLKNPSAVERWFQISARGSSIGQELRGGMVTFFTMAYILALNPVVIGTAADSRGNLVSGPPSTPTPRPASSTRRRSTTRWPWSPPRPRSSPA